MSGERTIAELDTVILDRDLPEHGLRRGDVGTVVHRYADGNGYEVELVAGDGTTIAVLTLRQADVRLPGSREILHVREVVTP